uniref:D-alanyl-D-alanine dipeptidase n=1 Tax=Acyrthosiphon pisum TaxID=7029 RepID=A0A8R2FDA2_ACYPI|eukprot:XP_008188976.1 PREDICTED: D-alanyl-D-alanine dipeptidase-like [Acyrthosiphon pisum]
MTQDILLTDLAAGFPTLAFDLKYATTDNITGYAIYHEARALLHPEAARALQKSVEVARLAGFTLLIFDAYRPQQAQWHLWDACPDADYVVPPATGSNHSRGVAIDLTLVDGAGKCWIWVRPLMRWKICRIRSIPMYRHRHSAIV